MPCRPRQEVALSLPPDTWSGTAAGGLTEAAAHRAAFRLALREAVPAGTPGPGALHLLSAARERLAAALALGSRPAADRARLADALREAYEALAAEWSGLS